MAAVIGDLLPLAIGIAISPIPIIAVILMLLSRKATATSTGFLLGWVVGIGSVAVPVVGYLAARDRMAAPLDRLRAWLTQNNAAVMAVLLLVIGTVLLGKGIAGF